MKLKLLEEIIKAFMDMMSLTNSEEKLTSSSIVIVIVPKFSMKYGIVITHTHIYAQCKDTQIHRYIHAHIDLYIMHTHSHIHIDIYIIQT